MKILHITASPFKTEGGVPVVLKELVAEQNKVEGLEARALSLCADASIINNRYIDDLKNTTFEKYVLDFQPNIAIFHSFFYVEFNHPVKVLHKLNIPYYLEPHGSFMKAGMKKAYLKKIIANATIFRNQIKYAKSFIFLNKKEQENSVYHKPFELVIPNGINKLRVSRPLDSFADEPFIYYIGRYETHEKGLDVFFDALSMLDNEGYRLNVELFGRGNNKELDFVSKSSSMFSHVKVRDNGSIYPNDQPSRLESRGIMILPSRHEGFPMTILEALSFGNPCIVSDGTNLSDELTSNNVGWHIEYRAEDIACKIKTAIDAYKEDRSGYIKRCKELVIKNYTWDVIAKLSYEQLNKNIKLWQK